MRTRPLVIAFVGFNVVIWALLLALRGVPVSWGMLWPFGLAVSATTIAATAFERRVWAWPVLGRWLVGRPDLRGTWRATVSSEWVDPKSGSTIPPVLCFAVVRQTLTTISVRLLTAESSSTPVAVALAQAPDGLYQLAGVYVNVPELGLRGNRSEIHNGAFLLNLQTGANAILTGEYWTERGTRGRFELTERNRRPTTSFAEAREALGGHRKGRRNKSM